MYTPLSNPSCVNFPFLSVLVTYVCPVSGFLISTLTSGYGLPSVSRTSPSRRAVPCAPATVANESARISAIQAGIIRRMWVTPPTVVLMRQSTKPQHYHAIQLSRNPCLARDPIRERIRCSCLGERTQPEPATIAYPARLVFKLIARPRALKRRAQIQSPAHDFTFTHRDHGRHNLTSRFRPRPFPNQILKRAIILRTAIGIARTVLRHRPDEKRVPPDNLRP